MPAVLERLTRVSRRRVDGASSTLSLDLSAEDLGTLVPALLAVALFGAWSAVDGGFPTTWWLPGGIFLAGLCVVSAVGGRADLGRLRTSQLVALAAFAALTVWSFLSLLWAGVTGDAWDGANRTLVYLLVLLLFSALQWRVATASIVLGAYVAVVGAVGVVSFWSTASSPDSLDFLGGRLANPTGYQNANAALFMMAFWPAVVVGSRRTAPVALRAVALGVATFLAELAFLCQSRGVVYAAPLVVLAMLVLVPGRLRTIAGLALPLAAIVAVRQPLLDVYDAGEHEGRLADALPPAAWAMLASAAAVAAVAVLWALVDRRVLLSGRVTRALGVGCVVVAIAAVAVAAPRLDLADRLDRGWSQFTGDQVTTVQPGSTHLGYGLSGNRHDLWSVGMRQFRNRPLLGEGVDNFAVAYLRERRYDEEPAYPHSLEVRMLGGLGLVGGTLCLLFVVAILVAATRRRGMTDSERALTGAATLPFLWWFVHGSVDWLWEFPALTGPALAFVALAGAIPGRLGGATSPRRFGIASYGSIALVALAVVSVATFLPPWLAARHVAAAQSGWRADPDAAYRSLERARALNPLSDNPDVVAGAIASRLRDDARARTAFSRALERNPSNWYAAMELGLLESVAGRRALALGHLARAFELNPLEGLIEVLSERIRKGERIHPSSLDQLFLDEALALVT